MGVNHIYTEIALVKLSCFVIVIFVRQGDRVYMNSHFLYVSGLWSKYYKSGSSGAYLLEFENKCVSLQIQIQ